jgi:DDE superfamily endonuclease
MLIVVRILENDVSRVKFPDDNQIKLYISLIKRRHPMLENAYCVGDGVKITIQASSDYETQKKYFNSWKQSHFISNLFFFGPDGMIIGSVLNAPGTFHDSILCTMGGFYDLLFETYERTGGRCVMDSAFASKDNPSIIISAKSISSAEGAEEILVSEQATSLRQAAEWGMNAIQSAFPRIKCRFRYEESGRRLLILLCVQSLYNYRCYHVGLNQIKTVYYPEWNRNYDGNNYF